METINRKKVLLICPFALPNLGGVESHISKLISYSVRRGFDITLLTYQPLTRNIRGASYEKGDHYEIYRVSWFGNGWFTKLEPYFPLVFAYLFPGLFVKSFIYFLQNHNKFKTVHAHGLIAGLITRILTIIWPKKTVISTHAVYNFDQRPILNFLVKQILIGFDKVLAVSEVSKEELIKMGIAVGKLAVHPNWIDTDIFKPINQDRSKFEKNVLFGVGRLIEKKGILLFLEAATLMPEINFHVVGGGPLEDTVKDYAQKNPNIKFYGVLMQNEPAALEKMVNLYSMCDYLVSPYLYDEGFSTTLIESLACGTPVLISDRGSPPTFLSKEVAYFLPAKPTAKDIVEYLNYLYKNPEIFNREKCTKYANDKFGFSNADTIVNEYLS